MSSELTKVTTHVDDALDRLIEQYRDKPRMAALITAFVNRVQEFEDALWDVYIQSFLDAAVGAQLAAIGKIVGQRRDGSEDDEYRVFIRARIRVNYSDGKMAQLLAIMSLILGDDAAIKARTLVPKALELEADDIQVNAFRLWRDFMNKAKAAGDSLHLVYTKRDSSQCLKLSSRNSDTEYATSQRLGSAWTAGVGGGALAGVFG